MVPSYIMGQNSSVLYSIGFSALILGCVPILPNRTQGKFEDITNPTDDWHDSEQSCSHRYDVHLTFDDGPLESTTKKVLDELAQRQVKATFFVLTSNLDAAILQSISERKVWNESMAYDEYLTDSSLFKISQAEINASSVVDVIAKRRALIQRATVEGHRIGTHTHRHKPHYNFPENSEQWQEILKSLTTRKKQVNQKYYFRSESDMKQSILDSIGILESLGWTHPKLIRMPFGAGFVGKEDAAQEKSGHKLRCLVKSLNLTHVLWNIDSTDYAYQSEKEYGSLDFNEKVARLKGHVLKQICLNKGGILLFHDANPVTSESIGILIDSIRSSGHNLVDFDAIAKGKHAASSVIKSGDDLMKHEELCD
jgi:peptidoglycan/xylan/chitin deacetylase (PgdA/CDA1 family)